MAADKDTQAQIKAMAAAIAQIAAKDEQHSNDLQKIMTTLDTLVAEMHSAKASRGSRAAPAAASADGAKAPATEAFPRDVKSYFVKAYCERDELRAKFDALATGARSKKEYTACKGDDAAKLKKEAALVWAEASTRVDMDGLVQETKTEFAKAREDRKAKAGVAAPASAPEEVIDAAKADLTAVASATKTAKGAAASKAPKAAPAPKAAKPATAAKTPKVAIPVPVVEEEDDVIPSDED
jgi:hypothetical protein